MDVLKLTHKEVLRVYHELENRRKKILSTQCLIVDTCNDICRIWGWDLSRRVYYGHSALIGSLSMEYHRLGEKMSELEEL